MDASINRRNKDSTTISSCSPTFLLHSIGLGPIPQLSDIEMITIKSVSYTSLKDLIPTSLSSSSSPNSSWHEIPIKNPLVKHAALAYLQPVGTPPVAGEKGLLEKVKEIMCCGECGCVSWLYGAVWRKMKEEFSGRRDDYHDEDDDKVD
ncbi:hypothetical protein V6N13_134342 [Hibiscus sabdariffa]|uniref:Uncharacterized protein n=1 Tax=Hibiscus sabdariffa TaxID=183260 RepID=A0ABR2R3Q2_9ROSI